MRLIPIVIITMLGISNAHAEPDISYNKDQAYAALYDTAACLQADLVAKKWLLLAKHQHPEIASIVDEGVVIIDRDVIDYGMMVTIIARYLYNKINEPIDTIKSQLESHAAQSYSIITNTYRGIISIQGFIDIYQHEKSVCSQKINEVLGLTNKN